MVIIENTEIYQGVKDLRKKYSSRFNDPVIENKKSKLIYAMLHLYEVIE